jgi:hypothetical protein
MTKINDRLTALERRKATSKVINGLDHVYDLMASIDAVGGGRTLLDRVDAGSEDDADRAAIAAVPGGLAAIRKHVTAMDHFYGGRP